MRLYFCCAAAFLKNSWTSPGGVCPSGCGTPEQVKRFRSDAFVECFRHVSEALAIVYRDLTRSSKHPLGGNAYLTLDNSEEPYLGGTRFTAMPPMKRFRDIEQLSGGEKTMAALALLFSIHR